MFTRPFDDINEGDLIHLIETKETEKRNVEYKVELPTELYESKKEFLADVSSFANAVGGYLVFGMREEAGIPVEIIGFTGINPDEQILRLENILRDSIEPRLQGVQIKAITLSSGSHAFILYIPRSWSRPHVVKLQSHWRFYSRNSAGKYPLDVGEVRSAFVESEGLPEKIRSFRNMRVSSIVSGETPISVKAGARIILHLIPFVSFEQAVSFSLSNLVNDPWSFSPIRYSTDTHRYNFDGYLTHTVIEDGTARGYVQVFRNGIIEAVDASILKLYGEERTIPSIVFEDELVKAVEKYLIAQKRILVPPPISLIITLVGVSGFYMAVNHSLDIFSDLKYVIDRDTLLLPEVIIWEYKNDASEFLHPIFDAVWNATGWPRSMNYNEAGEFRKGKNWVSAV
jgi:hypothetical protein